MEECLLWIMAAASIIGLCIKALFFIDLPDYWFIIFAVIAMVIMGLIILSVMYFYRGKEN